MIAVLDVPIIAAELPNKLLPPPQLAPHCFQLGHGPNGAGRPKHRRASWRMIGELVKQHPEYKSSIRSLLQASNCSTQLVAEALIRRVEDKDWRPQLRAVELIARITGELKEATIIQQQQISVEDSTKLQALAAALIAARPLLTRAASVGAPVAVLPPDSTVADSVADSSHAAPVSSSVETASEKQTPTPPLLP